MSGPGEITRLLAEWSGGNQAALDNLLPIVYDELRRVASNYMRGERPGHLLQTTALVHEAYLCLADQQNVNYRSRTQFFAIAAQIMRHILVDYARTRDRAKRGDGVASLALEDVAVLSEDRADELIAINSALDSLTEFDPRKGKVFELRYFGGKSLFALSRQFLLSFQIVGQHCVFAHYITFHVGQAILLAGEYTGLAERWNARQNYSLKRKPK